MNKAVIFAKQLIREKQVPGRMLKDPKSEWFNKECEWLLMSNSRCVKLAILFMIHCTDTTGYTFSKSK